LYALLAIGCSHQSAPAVTVPQTPADLTTTSDVAPPGTALYIIYFKRHAVPDVAAEATSLIGVTGGNIRAVYKYVEGFAAYLTPAAAARMAQFPTVVQVAKSGTVRLSPEAKRALLLRLSRPRALAALSNRTRHSPPLRRRRDYGERQLDHAIEQSHQREKRDNREQTRHPR
jgi:hypothetical protein